MKKELLKLSDIIVIKHAEQNKAATNQLKDMVQLDRAGSERDSKKKHF